MTKRKKSKKNPEDYDDFGRKRTLHSKMHFKQRKLPSGVPDLEGVRQGSLFDYTAFTPDDDVFPDELSKKGVSIYEQARAPSELTEKPYRGYGGESKRGDPFVYSVDEFREWVPLEDRAQFDVKGTRPFGWAQGTLYADTTELLKKLKKLRKALIAELNRFVDDLESEPGAYRENVEENEFVPWLLNESRDVMEALTEKFLRLQTVVDQLGGVDALPEDIIEACTDRGRWALRMGEPPENPPDPVVWDATVEFEQSERTMTIKTSSEVSSAFDVKNMFELLHHEILPIFIELEADTGMGEVSMRAWLKEKVLGKKNKCRVHKIVDVMQRDPVKNERFFVDYEAYANINVPAYATLRNAEALVQTVENLAAGYGSEDVGEGRVAVISDRTQRLPYTFPEGCDWSVWNLSADDLEAEGQAASHCVGDSGHYADQIRDEQIWIWSVKDGQQRTKFTLEVWRIEDRVHCFKQIKGKGNRLPGWASFLDFPPYGGDAYNPRKGLTASDVRRDEVLWLMELIKQATPLTALEAVTEQDVFFADWDEVLDNIDTPAGVSVLTRFCPDMLPGLYAVYTGKLWNARRENPRSRSRLDTGSFDHPYRRHR